VTRRRPARPHGRGSTGLPGPDSIEVGPRHLVVGGWHAATLIVTGYPAEVGPGWLEPLTSWPGRLDVSLHIEPVAPAVAAQQLRRQRARLESSRRHDAGHGRLDDPDAEAAADDARELAYRVARGEGRLFRAGLYLTVYAEDADQLAEEVAAVRSLAESMLLQAQQATFRTLQGWLTCLPLATDLLQSRRAFDTRALAAGFPFASPDLAVTDPAAMTAPAGILYGLNTGSAGIVCHDRWAQDNHNSVILGRSGSGKSYLAKLAILRQLYDQVQVAVIDPEDEYTRLATAVGGTIIRPGAHGTFLSPLALPAGPAREDALTRRALFTHTFISVLLGEDLPSADKAALDTAIIGAYHAAGITADPRTHARPAPLLADVAAALENAGDAGKGLAQRLAPYTTGSHSGLFAGQPDVRPGGHLAVWSLRELPEELRPAGILLTLDAIWQQVTSPERRRRLVVVDEAWLLMSHGEGARFLYRMAKAARKHWAGLEVITQDAEDVLGSELGRAVVANAATQVLLRQAPQAIALISEAFALSAGEREFLLSAPRGEGLLAASPTDRVAFAAVASEPEHRLATTSPEFLAELEAAGTIPGRGSDGDAADSNPGSYWQ
jgi:type IV secretory pathway VirB4 component